MIFVVSHMNSTRINRDLAEQRIPEDEINGNIYDGEEQSLNPQRRYAPRKQLADNRKVHDIDYFSNDTSFEKKIFPCIEREILKNM